MIPTQQCAALEEATDAKERLNVVIFGELMEAKGIKSVAALSRRTAALRSPVSKATIFRLIGGEVSASLRVARSLANALGTTVDTLFARQRGGVRHG